MMYSKEDTKIIRHQNQERMKELVDLVDDGITKMLSDPLNLEAYRLHLILGYVRTLKHTIEKGGL